MGILNSGYSTVGAGKSGAQSKRHFGPDARWFFPLIGLLLFVLSPVAMVVYAAGAVASQVRRVRPSRFALVATVCTVGGLAAVGFDPLRMLAWQANGTLSLWTPSTLFDWLQTAADTLSEWLLLPTITIPVGGYSLTEALLHSAPFAVPLGAWLATLYAGWMTYRRSALSGLEGRQFDWSRPAGLVDYGRTRRTRRRITTGAAVNARRSRVAVGVGRYGRTVILATRALQRPTLLFGGPRRGKTRQALNLLTQVASVGSGVLVIDFKADEEVPAHWAAFAATHNRQFKHFRLADKNGAAYRPPHPDVSDSPAYYDPLRQGNATSKTDMLVNSVGREGDAAAYFRSAYELSQVAYQVASLTGYDRDKGGFQVLEDLLDVDNLQRVADMTRPDGRGALDDHPALRQRVDTLVRTFRRDDVLRGSAYDLARILSTYGNGPAAGEWLRPGPTPEQTITLYDAVVNGEVVVFSLSVQEYGQLARDIGTLVLLDMQTTISQLRTTLGSHRAETGDPDAAPPWRPFYLQLEEFGSATPDAVLGVLNKGGDVQVRSFLSTQSWHDISAVDSSGTFARQVLDQAGNIFSFDINDGTAATVLSEATPEVTKCYARDRKELAAGLGGMGLRSANTGALEVTRAEERQVPAGAFQSLPERRCIWITKDPVLRVTHTHPPAANRWWEEIATEVVPPSIRPTAPHWRPPQTTHAATDDQTPNPQPPDQSDQNPTTQTQILPVGQPEPAPDGNTQQPAPTSRIPQDTPEGNPVVFRWNAGSDNGADADGPPLPEPDPEGESEEEPGAGGAASEPGHKTGKVPPQTRSTTQTPRQAQTDPLDLTGFDEFS